MLAGTVSSLVLVGPNAPIKLNLSSTLQQRLKSATKA